MKSYLVIKYASHYSYSSDYDLSAKYIRVCANPK